MKPHSWLLVRELSHSRNVKYRIVWYCEDCDAHCIVIIHYDYGKPLEHFFDQKPAYEDMRLCDIPEDCAVRIAQYVMTE